MSSPAHGRGQVRTEAPALVVGVDRELPEQDDRYRLGGVAPDPGGDAPSLDGAGGEAVEPGHALAVAGDVDPDAALGFVQLRADIEETIELVRERLGI
ncbi:MAG: hypothetical protein OXU81_01270 [Gammaproteobacteria bacterium]|nr:hypothetical protein [Gammaproteobacteria bacterium]